jgi:GTP-binding protein YchF
MELGIVGLRASGKTSLFNAVTGGKAKVGEYSASNEPNLGVVFVPDERLDALAAIFNPKKLTYADIRWVDFPSEAFGPSGVESATLTRLSGVDALVHVVRAFEDAAVPHPSGSVDLHRDLEELELELNLTDLGLIERRLSRLDAEMRSVKAGERGVLERDRALLERLRDHLEAGHALRSLELDEQDERELRQYQFVTQRPQLIVVNLGEDALSDQASIEQELTERYGGPGVAVAALCASLEAELVELDDADAAEMRRDLGLPETGALGRAITAAYELLGVHSFLTVGEDECRAWTVQVGSTAPEAAGRIHTDLERGFIRAEVANWEDVIEAGSFAEVKKRGKLRTEGKSYVVHDGDVINVLFNV